MKTFMITQQLKSISIPQRKIGAALATMLIYLIALLIAALFICILLDIIIQGFCQISCAYLTESPTDAGRAGGISPIIVSTALIVLVAIINEKN